MLLLYDLPVLTARQRHAAYHFRKKLISLGFSQLQESVYILLVHNDSMTASEISKIKKFVPKEGTVQVLPISLNVFQGLQTLTGEPYNHSLFSDDFVVL